MARRRVVLLTQSGREIVAIVGQTGTHTRGNTVTDYPVEGGFNASDGATGIPRTFTFNGLFPDDPIQFARRPKINVEQVDAAFQREGGKVFTEAAAPRLDYAAADTLSQGVRDVLHDICDRQVVISIITGTHVYINMIMTSLTEPEDSETGEALKFTANFKQIRVATSKVVFIEEGILAATAPPAAASPQNTGKQPKEQPDDTTEEKGQSALAWLTGRGSRP